jgi:hypothetical protein
MQQEVLKPLLVIAPCMSTHARRPGKSRAPFPRRAAFQHLPVFSTFELTSENRQRVGRIAQQGIRAIFAG